MVSRCAHDLAEIARCYEEALAELEHEDTLDHTSYALNRVDALLRNLSAPEPDDHAGWRQLRAAREAHDRLLRSIETQREQVERLRAAHRESRRVLASYGSRLPTTGSRVAREA